MPPSDQLASSYSRELIHRGTTVGEDYVSGAIARSDGGMNLATAADIRRLRQGRGRGFGSKYEPWLYIWEVPSRGLSWRISGWHHPRIHHLLSNLERDYFYTLEWPLSVVEIREQYPLLPLAETLAIARDLGIRHPREPKTRLPIVMTTDFLVTRVLDGEVMDQARSVKPWSQLTARALEKFKLEALYWEKRGVDWSLVTQNVISTTVARNVAFLHSHRPAAAIYPVDAFQIERIGILLDEGIRRHEPLARIAVSCDARIGHKPGTSLKVARHLLANRRWPIDIAAPIDPAQPVVLRQARDIDGSG